MTSARQSRKRAAETQSAARLRPPHQWNGQTKCTGIKREKKRRKTEALEGREALNSITSWFCSTTNRSAEMHAALLIFTPRKRRTCLQPEEFQPYSRNDDQPRRSRAPPLPHLFSAERLWDPAAFELGGWKRSQMLDAGLHHYAAAKRWCGRNTRQGPVTAATITPGASAHHSHPPPPPRQCPRPSPPPDACAF